MKVAHVCDAFSMLSETFIYDVILELERQGIKNSVLAANIVNMDTRPFHDVVKIPDQNSNFIKRGWNKVQVLTNILHPTKALWKNKEAGLYKILTEKKPQLIHAHYAQQGCLVLPLARRLNIPLIVSFHGFDAFGLNKKNFWKQELKELFLQSTLITVVSKLMKEHLINVGCPAEKIHVIHVGKKIEDYSFINKPSRTVQSFMSVGRLVAKKGHLDCVNAFKKVVTDFPDVTLTIIGAGPLYSEIEAFIKSNNLRNNIFLLGEINHEEVKEHFYGSDAFILCSKEADDGDREGVPTVLMEAQAFGLPCVSTVHSGIPEVIPEENHWLLAAENDIDGIAEKIKELIQLPSERLTELIHRGRHKVINEFNLSKEVSKLNSLYNLIVIQNK